MSKNLTYIILALYVLYLAIFLRTPKVDYQASRYTFICDSEYSNLGGKGGNFNNLGGDEILVTYDSPKQVSFTTTNQDADILAKVVCANKSLPADLEEFTRKTFEAVETKGLRERVLQAKSNYRIILLTTRFTSSWGIFFIKLLAPLLALGLWIVLRKK